MNKTNTQQLNEKALSKAQQQAAGIALAAKREGKKPKKGTPSAAMADMSTKELEKFAGTKHKGLPKHKKTAKESIAVEAKKAKPDYIDIDKDGDKTEPMKKAAKDAKKKMPAKAVKGKKEMSPKQAKFFGKKVKEGKKMAAVGAGVGSLLGGPLGAMSGAALGDVLGGEDEKTESMKSKKKMKKVKESSIKQSYKIILESLNYYISEDEEGKAKDITAGTEIVNDFTSWMQRVGQYQTKSSIELADSIRANFGQAQAESFKAAIAPALEQTLSALTSARETIARAVAVLAGEEQEPMTGVGAQAPEEMGPPEGTEDEFAASDAAAGGMETAGRETRESKILQNVRRLAESHSIMYRLAK